MVINGRSWQWDTGEALKGEIQDHIDFEDMHPVKEPSYVICFW